MHLLMFKIRFVCKDRISMDPLSIFMSSLLFSFCRRKKKTDLEPKEISWKSGITVSLLMSNGMIYMPNALNLLITQMWSVSYYHFERIKVLLFFHSFTHIIGKNIGDLISY